MIQKGSSYPVTLGADLTDSSLRLRVWPSGLFGGAFSISTTLLRIAPPGFGRSVSGSNLVSYVSELGAQLKQDFIGEYVSLKLPRLQETYGRLSNIFIDSTLTPSGNLPSYTFSFMFRNVAGTEILDMSSLPSDRSQTLNALDIIDPALTGQYNFSGSGVFVPASINITPKQSVLSVYKSSGQNVASRQLALFNIGIVGGVTANVGNDIASYFAEGTMTGINVDHLSLMGRVRFTSEQNQVWSILQMRKLHDLKAQVTLARYVS